MSCRDHRPYWLVFCFSTCSAHRVGWVRAIQVSGKSLVSGSGDHTVKFWNLTALQPLPLGDTTQPASVPHVIYDTINTVDDDDILKRTFVGHSGGISCLQFDSQWLLSGSLDKTIRQWDVNTGECISILRSEKWVDYADKADQIVHGIPGTASTPFSNFMGQEDRTWFNNEWTPAQAQSSSRPSSSHQKTHTFENPILMNAQGQQKVKVYHTGGFVGALQFWQHALAAGYGDGNIRLWDLRTSNCHRTLEGHLGAVTTLAFDDTHIVSGSSDKTVKIYDLRNGAILDELVFTSAVTSVSFDAWKILIAAGGRDVKVYSRTNSTFSSLPEHDEDDELSEVGGGYHTKSVRCVKIVQDWGVSGGMDGLVNVWKL